MGYLEKEIKGEIMKVSQYFMGGLNINRAEGKANTSTVD